MLFALRFVVVMALYSTRIVRRLSTTTRYILKGSHGILYCTLDLLQIKTKRERVGFAKVDLRNLKSLICEGQSSQYFADVGRNDPKYCEDCEASQSIRTTLTVVGPGVLDTSGYRVDGANGYSDPHKDRTLREWCCLGADHPTSWVLVSPQGEVWVPPRWYEALTWWRSSEIWQVLDERLSGVCSPSSVANQSYCAVITALLLSFACALEWAAQVWCGCGSATEPVFTISSSNPFRAKSQHAPLRTSYLQPMTMSCPSCYGAQQYLLWITP